MYNRRKVTVKKEYTRMQMQKIYKICTRNVIVEKNIQECKYQRFTNYA